MLYSFVATSLESKLGLPHASRSVAFLFETVSHAAGEAYGAASLPRATVTAAFSTLCGGDTKATTECVFAAFGNEAAEGFELGEVRRFLRIVFLVSLGLAESSEGGRGEVTTAHLASHSARGERLAENVVESQFSAMSAMHVGTDGTLTRAEFQTWLATLPPKPSRKTKRRFGAAMRAGLRDGTLAAAAATLPAEEGATTRAEEKESAAAPQVGRARLLAAKLKKERAAASPPSGVPLAPDAAAAAAAAAAAELTAGDEAEAEERVATSSAEESASPLTARDGLSPGVLAATWVELQARDNV